MIMQKGSLQKLARVSAVVSYALAVVAGVMLYLRLESVGMGNPISASMMASTFFFIFVGAILAIMGNADIPSFKFDDPEGK